MAGVIGPKWDPKNKQNTKIWNSPEYHQNNSYNQAPVTSTKTESRPTFSLSGILGLNQSVELHPKSTPAKEQIFFPSHLEKESKILLDSHQKELAREIESLRLEIKKLLAAATTMGGEIEKAAFMPVAEANSYQLRFIDRLRNMLAGFRRNVCESTAWLQTQTKKKSRKNAFWGKVKNKKTGGEQYLFSNEHSAARSIN